MQLELTDEETFALLNLLVDTIEADRYPMSPRIRLLREILAKCGEVGGLPPELAAGSAGINRRRPLAGQQRRNATRTGPHGEDGDRCTNA